jgi:intein/homing endonuclease
MSDGGRKNIEDVRVGEQVLSRRESGEVTSSRVEQVLSPVSDSMCRIGFASGESLEVTESHPLYTREGWKAIDTDVAARERESVAVTALGVGEDGRLGFYGRGLD